jgi:hypothetical protein
LRYIATAFIAVITGLLAYYGGADASWPVILAAALFAGIFGLVAAATLYSALRRNVNPSDDSPP